ncbi:HBS1-like protein isoform X1 [Salvia divinorum]|uniref:HBS1-like protein isoform X1 n=1 Tax=Salvia divinorum TaxID=28513 RepID=A0ABD1I561_SALDI
MPRKVNYGVDYDDDYEDDYGYDYDYDYDEEVEENGITAKTMPTKEVRKTKVWRCPICTYDNEDSMSACDICGILRNPLVKSNIQINDVTVGGICKDSGVSVMAKSLFASLPQHRVQPSIFEVQDDVSSTDNNLNLHKFRNMRSTFSEFSSAFSYQNHKRVNIAPFKFNVPSPDDLVSSGLQSLKMKSKDSQRDTNIPAELELSAKDQESTSASVTRQRGNRVNEKDYAPTSESIPGMSHSNVNTEAMSSKTGNVEKTIERKTASISDFTPETWMIPETVDGELSQLNLAIVGHVDSGKSTLSGRLLHLSGRISQKLMHKYEKEAKQQGKGSFAYAWALDESAEERERGITMTVGVAFFTSKKYHIVLLDSPGHRDFVPNMISGATQADAAILVVDASMGSFEAGIDATGGQTREHAQLIRSFGVGQIIVLVNKMDVVGYSRERFDFVKQKLGTFLRTCGFKESSISWVPASVMENQNLVANSSDSRLLWYKGPFLMDAIDSLQLPTRDYSKPLLIPICDVKSQSQSQVSACGKLENGAIRPGLKVLVMPSKEIATVRSLERDSQTCSIARAGDNVTVNLQGIEGNRVTAGSVICHPDYPVQVASQLEMKILVLEISTPIVIGSELEFHIHHAKEAAKIVKILSLLDPKTGKVTKKSPRCLLSKQNAMVEVALQGPVCVEEYSSCRALGRVFLRASGRTIGLGVVTQIIKTEN